MRNSTARERIPTTCRHVRYEGGHAKACTKPFRHADPKHSFDEADEESDMQAPGPRALACDKSVTCPADFHDIGCQAYRREQTQQAPGYHHFVGRDGTVATTYPDGSIKLVTPMGKETRIPPLDEETKQRLRAERGSWPSADERAKFILEERAKKTLTIHTSEEKTGGRAEVSHHTAGAWRRSTSSTRSSASTAATTTCSATS
ncbi:hypothetical protein GS489_07855 [Rhodococcus hoagii]|nr:hypothetical protein [Prescottella equi]